MALIFIPHIPVVNNADALFLKEPGPIKDSLVRSGNFGLDRKAELYFGSFSRSAFDLDFSAVCIHDRLAQAQSESIPAGYA